MKRLFGLILLASTLFMQCSKDELGSDKASKFVKALSTTNNEYYTEVSATNQGYLLVRMTRKDATSRSADLLFFDLEGNIKSATPFPQSQHGDNSYAKELVPLASGDVISTWASKDSPTTFASFLAKYNASGAAIWAKIAPTNLPISPAVGTVKYENPEYIVERPDKQLVVLVRLEHNLYYDNQPATALMCRDESGNFVWAKLLPRTSIVRNVGGGTNLIALEDNSVIAAYREVERTGSYRHMLCKMDKNGNVLWSKILQESAGWLFKISKIGQQIFALSANSGANSATLYEIGNNGESTTLGHFPNLRTSISAPHLLSTKDGNLMFIYGSEAGTVFTKISPKGQQIWSKTIETPEAKMYDVAACSDGGFIFHNESKLYKTDANANVE